MTWRPSRTPRECREIKEQYTVGRFVIHSYGNGKRLFLVTKNPCISFSALNPNVCTQKNGEPQNGASCRHGKGAERPPFHGDNWQCDQAVSTSPVSGSTVCTGGVSVGCGTLVRRRALECWSR